MKVIKLTMGAFETNCYIVGSSEGNAAVIDPADSADVILEALARNKLNLKMILLTHGHFDHIGACEELAVETGAEVYVNEKDNQLLSDYDKNVGVLKMYVPQSHFKAAEADKFVKEGDEIHLDEVTFKVMETPGHPAGSVCYFTDGCLFSGDTLFRGSIGRSDNYSGDPVVQQKTLMRLCEIQGDYKLYAGHGDDSTLKYEQHYNPYLA